MSVIRCLRLLMLHFPLFLIAEAQRRYYSCSKPTYAIGSAYENNLNSLLASLRANAPVCPGFFYNTTVGNGPDLAYGLVQCRKDISADDCSNCSASSASYILQVCGNSKSAVIWFDFCLLRYSSVDFFGKVDSLKMALYNVNNVSNPSQFAPVVLSLFNNLSVSATTHQSSLSFSTDSIPYNSFMNLYRLLECTGDLSPNLCISCLNNSIAFMSQCCLEKQGARTLSGSCVIRYEMYPFFGNSTSPSLSNNASLVNKSCSAGTNESASSGFRQNLKTLLRSLSTINTTTSGVDELSDVYGKDSADRVYGQVQCRGDVPADVCRGCTVSASSQIQVLCAGSAPAIIWLDYCQLRYANANFSGKPDVIDKYYLIPEGQESELCFPLGSLINNLTTGASSKDSSNKFETGSKLLKGSQTLHALVQCTADLSRSDCKTCLDTLASEIQSACSRAESALLTGSCRAQYALKPFFFDEQGSLASTEEPNSPMPPATSSGGMEFVVSREGAGIRRSFGERNKPSS